MDAANPCRQGIETDCCLRGMTRPDVSKVTSSWTPAKVAPNFRSIIVFGPNKQPRLDAPNEHAWSTLHTCESVFVTNTKRRSIKRSLNAKIKEPLEGVWIANPASFECYENIDQVELELILCHMPAKILAPEHDELKVDAPEPDVDLLRFGEEWDPTSQDPPEIDSSCDCPFFRHNLASKAECSLRTGRIQNEWFQWPPLRWPDVDPEALVTQLLPITHGDRVIKWDIDVVVQVARLHKRSPKDYSTSGFKITHPREWSMVAQLFAMETQVIEPGSLVPLASEGLNNLIPIAAYGPCLTNGHALNNVVYYGHTVPTLLVEEWLKTQLFRCACGHRIVNFLLCLYCKSALFLAVDDITIRTLETEAELDGTLRWDDNGPVKPARNDASIPRTPVSSVVPVLDADNLVWLILMTKKPAQNMREKLRVFYANNSYKLFKSLRPGYWRGLMDHMTHWDSIDYRHLCAFPSHPAMLSGPWEVHAGEDLVYLSHCKDNTPWRVQEDERKYGWIPDSPHEFNKQFRDILPIARVVHIHRGAIQWMNSVMSLNDRSLRNTSDFLYTKRFLVAQAKLAMKLMEQFPHLPDELPDVPADIKERKDWLTPEVLDTLVRCFDMRDVTTYEFWQWLWPLNSQPMTLATIGPISTTDVEDICTRARAFDIINEQNVPEWFATRMTSSPCQ